MKIIKGTKPEVERCQEEYTIHSRKVYCFLCNLPKTSDPRLFDNSEGRSRQKEGYGERAQVVLWVPKSRTWLQILQNKEDLRYRGMKKVTSSRPARRGESQD